MEFFKIRRDIPFMENALVFNVISFLTFAAAVFFLTTRGLHLSVEFTGGTVMEVDYSQTADVENVRRTVSALGFADVQVQNFGTSHDVLIRLPAQKGVSSAQQSEKVLSALKADNPAVSLRRTEFVGPQVGEELATDGLKALGMVESAYARAVLAVLGYSVNESVVIFDRIRENFRRYRKMNTVQIIDSAITSTISRTIITHGCTQAMVLSMLLFGGPTLHYFALALTIGILFGIYSSVFVAAAIAMWLGIKREDLVKSTARKDEDPQDPNAGATV